MSNWQPIDSAPKDQRILILTKDEVVFIARWAAPAGFERFEERDGWQVFDCEDGFYSHAEDPGDVTHWTPLPDPPVSSAERGTPGRRQINWERRRHGGRGR